MCRVTYRINVNVFSEWLLCVVELYHGVCTVVAKNITRWMLERRDRELTPMSVAVLDTTHILPAHASLSIFTYAQARHISVNFVYTTHYTMCFKSHYADFRLHSRIPTVSKLVRKGKAMGVRGGVVVNALCYKPAGCGFDSRWCHCNISVT